MLATCNTRSTRLFLAVSLLTLVLAACGPTPGPAPALLQPAAFNASDATTCKPENGGTYTFRSVTGQPIVATARTCFGKGENACAKQDKGVEFSITIKEVSYASYKYYFFIGESEYFIRIGDVECVKEVVP